MTQWTTMRTTKYDLKWANVVVKTVPINLVWSRVATDLQFVKKQKQKVSSKCDKVEEQ